MIELVVLDIAGTTIEEHQAVYAALLDTVRNAGATPTDAELARWHGAGKREAITGLLGESGIDTDDARIDAAVEDFHANLTARYRDQPPTPLPGIPEAVAQLRAAGIKVALTTGYDRETVELVLEAAGWGPAEVDAVICVDDVPAGRPAPYMIFRAMERTGVHDVRAVATAGDTPRDLEAGVNSGAAIVVGVLSGASTEQDLAGRPNTTVLPSVVALPALVTAVS